MSWLERIGNKNRHKLRHLHFEFAEGFTYTLTPEHLALGHQVLRTHIHGHLATKTSIGGNLLPRILDFLSQQTEISSLHISCPTAARPLLISKPPLASNDSAPSWRQLGGDYYTSKLKGRGSNIQSIEGICESYLGLFGPGWPVREALGRFRGLRDFKIDGFQEELHQIRVGKELKEKIDIVDESLAELKEQLKQPRLTAVRCAQTPDVEVKVDES